MLELKLVDQDFNVHPSYIGEGQKTRELSKLGRRLKAKAIEVITAPLELKNLEPSFVKVKSVDRKIFASKDDQNKPRITIWIETVSEGRDLEKLFAIEMRLDPPGYNSGLSVSESPYPYGIQEVTTFIGTDKEKRVPNTHKITEEEVEYAKEYSLDPDRVPSYDPNFKEILEKAKVPFAEAVNDLYVRRIRSIITHETRLRSLESDIMGRLRSARDAIGQNLGIALNAYSEAREKTEEALHLNPNNSRINELMFTCLYETGLVTRGLHKTLDVALQYLALAQITDLDPILKEGKLKEKYEHIIKGIPKVLVDESRALVSEALTLESSGKIDEAKEVYSSAREAAQKALKLDEEKSV